MPDENTQTNNDASAENPENEQLILLREIKESLKKLEANNTAADAYKNALKQALDSISATVVENNKSIAVIVPKIDALGTQLSLVPTEQNVIAQFDVLLKELESINNGVGDLSSSNTEIILAISKLTADATEVFNKNTEVIVQNIQDHKVFLEQFLTQLQSKSDSYLEMKYEANAAMQNADTILKGIYDSITTINSCIDNMNNASEAYNKTFQDLNAALTRVVDALGVPNKLYLYTEALENVTTAIKNIKPEGRTV